ncbi:PLP-dependent aminotransferase family protein [Marinobacterium mangrovicola]|uniref:GntR family transcriptional regulator n=1 Tax=Marinobacterium mangrovicola TaxID=1476959 RepID=A0A4R1H8M1_9GAMM|nr:PLP-dependent aminotransferase family protein [Marinobacterium mangrovicola]TCK16435.1 GntR family transcriptional regulator [Marinobacterium mangrovicola]
MPRARYKQLVDRFASDIRTGNLAPGSRLPTHRELAGSEGVALVTASRAYAELEKMGLISGEQGRGTFVRETTLPPGQGIDQRPVPKGTLDLNFNSPSIDGQSQLLREALRQLSVSGELEPLLHYQPHSGRQHERSIIATHLKQRDLHVDADQVLITSGAQHGLAITALALLNPGDIVAVDSLIYPGFKTVAEVSRLELAPLPFTESGPDLEALQKLCRQRRVKAVYTQPTLHNPLGWVLSLAQREALVAIAREHDLMLIEDAAYAFHADHPPPPVSQIAPERSIYISGLSKSLATGLRCGFLAAPIEYVAQLERAIRATTWNTPGLITALACQWVADGTVTQLEEQKREDARARQLIVRQVFNDWDYIAHPNAYFIWLPLPAEVRADRVCAELLEQGISVASAEPFATTEHAPHALRLALGSVKPKQLEAALLKVKEVIEDNAALMGTRVIKRRES